ncbi:hypothetical protein BREVNS_0146 [Brevinematales bacterium NS]|nr:hypothetical protein BREVNS_0146 [Brevinematales bacterium NS]
MRGKIFLVGMLLFCGCAKGWNPELLYNEGISRWNEGKKAEALWYLKKAYLLDPGQRVFRLTYESMRVEFPDKPAMERVVLGVAGVNGIAWLAVVFLLMGGGLVVVRYMVVCPPWIQKIQNWPFLKHVMVVLYLIGGILLVIQGVAGVRLFVPEPAVVVEKASLLDRPEESALVLQEIPAGIEGWILKRKGAYTLFRSESGLEGWMLTNGCWGVWQ